MLAAGYNPCDSVTCGAYEVCRLSANSTSRHSVRCVCADVECDAVMKPVCASDGLSYDNECEMRRQSCAVKQRIYVRSRGLCGKPFLAAVSSNAGASEGTNGDAKCVAVIIGGGKNKEVGEDKIYLFVSRENKRTKPIKQSNKCVNVYV